MSRRRLLPLIVIAVALAGCGARCASAAPDDQPATFEFGGLSRTYLVHLPPGRPAGLVVNLHGGGSTGSGEERLTNFDAVADADGFVVVYPDGIDNNWADGRGASEPDRRGVDDVGFLTALAGKLQNEYGIDPGHVFATGMSNGGFMSNRLGCDRADVFAAVAPVSGTLGAGVSCNPSRPVSVLEVHGTADPLVPFDGGTMRGRGGTSDVVSAPAMVERWRSADGCQGAPAAETLPSTGGDGTVVHRFTSAPCAAGTAVVFYQVDDGGHTWPGGPQYLPKAIIGPTTHAFAASEAIGQFFTAHGH
jgi:polyhydroxybutyrate depolymerase